MGRDEIMHRLPVGAADPPGMDCLGDDRDAMNDFAKYYNNSHLSDCSILIGTETYPAHRIILAKGSEVFDRMLSQRWAGPAKGELEIKLEEDPSCQKVFPAFLRFLYCNHVVLHHDNTLPLLVLADKYNVCSLKKVCLDLAVSAILPSLDLREVFSQWFSYATKAYHEKLIRGCVDVIAKNLEDVISKDEWEKEWTALDREQICEILKHNNIIIKNEFLMWNAVHKWLSAPNHPERRGPTAAPLMAQVIPLIRFPLMTAEELMSVEASPFCETHAKVFHPQIALSYKMQAISLASRAANKEMASNCILRNYTDVRWDKRIVITQEQIASKGIEHEFKISTRSYTIQPQVWQWTLKFTSTTYSLNGEDTLRAFLVAEAIDQPRYIEYLLSFVDDKKVLRNITGKNQFTKSRYSVEIDFDRKISVSELIDGSSPLLANRELHIQLSLKPPSGYDA